MTETTETTRSRRKNLVGMVVSDRQDKTIVVRVDRMTAHPRYRKVITRSRKHYVHDEHNEARTGDRVEISETRPLSKTKRWRLVRIVQRAVTE